MKIVISGSSGLVGTALAPALAAAGHQVLRLIRDSSKAGPGESGWDPVAGHIDPSLIDNADAIVNLNGQNIGARRWSAEVKTGLRRSRLDSTRTLASATARSATPPTILLNASATGFYGDRGEEALDETSPAGNGFLAELTRDWEQAAAAATSNQTRVVAARLGMVVAADGALGKMLLPFKMGAGGPIGSGRQYWPWIGLEDVCGAIIHILEHDEITGPVNLVSPRETRCAEFTSTLGRVLHRPAFVPLPAFAARLALGEMAEELLLSSTRVRSKVLDRSGYVFRTPDLEGAFREALGR